MGVGACIKYSLSTGKKIGDVGGEHCLSGTCELPCLNYCVLVRQLLDVSNE